MKMNKDPQSVHLCDYPKSDKKSIDLKLEDNMKEGREIVALALAKRAQAGLKTRQPLSKLEINNKKIIQDKELKELIKDEVNIKEVIFGKEIKLDIKITNELKIEGIVRDLIRFIQGMRKDGELRPGQNINLYYLTNPKLENIIQDNQKEIQQEVTAKKIEIKENKKQVFLIEKEVQLDGQDVWLGIKK